MLPYTGRAVHYSYQLPTGYVPSDSASCNIKLRPVRLAWNQDQLELYTASAVLAGHL